MLLIIAGSRSLSPTPARISLALKAAQASDPRFQEPISEVVSGCARGADKAGEQWAAAQAPPIPVRRFPADWRKHGMRAGYVRNEEMAKYADAALVFYDGRSKGAEHMARTMRGLKRPTYVQVMKVEAGRETEE